MSLEKTPPPAKTNSNIPPFFSYLLIASISRFINCGRPKLPVNENPFFFL